MRGIKYLIFGGINIGIILSIIILIQSLLLTPTDSTYATMVQVTILFILAVCSYAKLLMLIKEYMGE